jgi:hypothetical protein
MKLIKSIFILLVLMGSLASINAQIDSTSTPVTAAATPAIYDVVIIKVVAS